MIIIIVSGLMWALGTLMGRTKNKYIKEISLHLGILGGIICGAALFLIPVQQLSERSTILEYHAFKETIKVAREDGFENIERAALINQIATVNAWLAQRQYWNNFLFDIYIPDEIMELEPLK